MTAQKLMLIKVAIYLIGMVGMVTASILVRNLVTLHANESLGIVAGLVVAIIFGYFVGGTLKDCDKIFAEEQKKLKEENDNT